MRGQINELRELTAETLEAVRKLAVELRPATLDDLGLRRRPGGLYRRVRARACPSTSSFSADGFDDRDGRLPPQVELVLYRVVQEALTNVGQARRRPATCDVELCRRPHEVVAADRRRRARASTSRR